MFVESAFITREFKEEPIPVLEKVTSLSVLNKGTAVAQINGVLVHPTQKQILIVPDGTFSRVQLDLQYIKKVKQETCKVLLIYKKLM